MEHRHPVGHGQRLALVVCDVDHGDAEALVQMLDFHLHVLAKLLVQRSQGLVHQHQLRLEDQRAGQRHALLLATGKLRRITPGEGVELDHRQRALDPFLHVGLAHAADAEGKGQVLGHGHVREQRIVLEHHADVALVRRDIVDRATGQEDFAGGGGFETGQHHQAGGLAGPGGAEQGEEFALANVQVEILHDEGLAVVALLHATEADQYIAALSLGHNRTFVRFMDAVRTA